MTREEKEQTFKYVLQMANFLADGCYQQEMLLKALHIMDEALEQEPYKDIPDIKDCISRKDTLEKFKQIYFDNHTVIRCAELVLGGMPSVNSQQKWIPVNERLPKIADVYRVTRYYPNNVMSPKYIVDACFFDGSNNWYNDIRINHERAYADNVVAWQENPEPYRPESEKQS